MKDMSPEDILKAIDRSLEISGRPFLKPRGRTAASSSAVGKAPKGRIAAKGRGDPREKKERGVR